MRNYTLIHLVYVVILDMFHCLRYICWNVFRSCSCSPSWLHRVKIMKTIGCGRILKSNIEGKKVKYSLACTREVCRNSRVYTKSDNKVMRLVPKKLFYFFINYNQLQRDTKFFIPQFFSHYQMNGFPVHAHFISKHLDLIWCVVDRAS
jgi:hypothetical protein